ncbi:MAG: DUF4360 domain-containing protein [Polyangiales bacterium]
MQRPSSLRRPVLTMAVLACASGCMDDASARGGRDALALTDDPTGAEAGDVGSAGSLLDAGEAPAFDGGETVDAGIPDSSTPPDGPGIVPSPEGAYYASVVANGTGCPPGTWHTAVAADGKSFSAHFSAYEVVINAQVPDLVRTRNCTLGINVHSPKGLSYSVKSMRLRGYAFLEQGVTASISTWYYFQGSPVPPTSSNRVGLVGPYDDDFVFRDDVRTEDAVWSPCAAGVERELLVNTMLLLQHSAPKRSGYVNLGSEPTAVALELAWRACEVPARAERIEKR